MSNRDTDGVSIITAAQHWKIFPIGDVSKLAHVSPTPCFKSFERYSVEFASRRVS